MTGTVHKLLLAFVFCVPAANAQGCSQCRETVGQTTARTQTAYRKAILLMVGAGTTVCTATYLAIRRFR